MDPADHPAGDRDVAPSQDIDVGFVARVADLARLSLSQEELAATTDDLRAILGHFEAIGAVDTEGVEPLAHVLSSSGRPAADEVAPFPDARVRITANTDHAREGFFVVPRVLDETAITSGETSGGPAADDPDAGGLPSSADDPSFEHDPGADPEDLP